MNCSHLNGNALGFFAYLQLYRRVVSALKQIAVMRKFTTLNLHDLLLVCCAFLGAFFLTTPTYGQTAADGVQVVIEIDGLTPQQHGDIYHALSSASAITLERACVPASLLLFSLPDDDSVNALKALIAGTGIPESKISKSELNANGFDARCSELRSGR